MEAYIAPGWLTIIAGLVIYRRQPETKVLFGLRSAREAAGQWCLPTGLGAIRRDISNLLAGGAPDSLKDPIKLVQFMSERHRLAFRGPAGFALAEAKWYVDLPPDIEPQHLIPLKPVCQLDREKLLVKIYFGLEWPISALPRPAVTEWPFKEVRFFSREELKGIPIAFGCDRDLDDAFWPYRG